MLKFKDSQVLREQIVNIIDDLVEGIVPGYLSPDSFYRVDYSTEIYERVYKKLWREFGKKRSQNASYRSEVFEFLRKVPSENFFTVTELLLKVVCWIVHIQIIGYEKWGRSTSVREQHIQFFKDSVDEINDRILENNSKCLYTLEGESVQLVRLDTGSDVPEKNNDIQGQYRVSIIFFNMDANTLSNLLCRCSCSGEL